jgi:hypothetical protein
LEANINFVDSLITEKKRKERLEKGLFYLFILLLLLIIFFYVLNSQALPINLSQQITELNDCMSSSLMGNASGNNFLSPFDRTLSTVNSTIPQEFLDDTNNTRKSGIGRGRGGSSRMEDII